jgi:hypothetical protein
MFVVDDKGKLDFCFVSCRVIADRDENNLINSELF